ncbi:MAG: universal stress protein [Ilumatobacteraceae bacterium]
MTNTPATADAPATADHLLVLGDDGSPAADLAWLWINCHEWPQWRLEIVTAEATTNFRVDSDRASLRPWQPDNPRRPFAESQLRDVAWLTCELDPRLALSRPADLLVIGRRGPGLAKAMHLGSTAEWLMAHPPAPMLIVRHGRRTRSAVVCADGSPHSLAAASTLASMPWIGGVAITVVSVDDGDVDVEPAVEATSALFSGTGAQIQRRDARGEPTHELLAVLEEIRPDLVALGTQGLTGIKRLRLGSTAGVVTHAVDCSILLASDESALASSEDR